MAYLKWEDYVVIVITLALSLGTGLFKSLRGKKDQTTTQYIMGDGKMAILPVALSLLVTYQSGIMMLGIPAEVYLYGMLYTTAMLGDFLCDLFTAQVFVPTLRRLKVTSIFEYLEIRYDSHGIRIFGTVLSVLFAINYIGIVLAMPAVTLKAVAGIDIWTSIVTLIIVVLIYTLIGGFTAVIWTDVLQSILMFGGIFAVLIKGTMNAGGLTKTWRTVYDQGRINLFVFDIDPTIRLTFWNLVVGNFITNLGNPFQQTSFLRIKATPNVQTSKRMYLFAMFLAMIMRIFTGMGGAIMFAYYYSKGCDPLVSKQLDNPNQLMPAMVLDIFQETPGLPGLFLAALFCASLSTLSSILSGIMSVFWEDIVKPHTKPMSERRGIITTQLSGLIFGLIGVGIAFLVTEIKGSVIQIFMTTTACLGGAITGIFVLGFVIPWANKWGAIVGGATSVFLVAWITLGKMTSSGTRKNPTLDPAPIDSCPLLNISATSIYNNNLTTPLYDSDVTMRHGINEPHGLDVLYSLSYRWLQPIGIITVLLIGTLVSRLTRLYSVTTTVAPELVVPVFDFLCYCMPANIRERLRCGVHYHSPNDVQENLDDGRVKDTVLNQTQPTS